MKTAKCRFCGAVGEETPDDVAPGVCPACLDKRMAAATKEFEAGPPGLRRGLKLLRRVGLTDSAAWAFLMAALAGQPPDEASTVIAGETR